MDRPSTPQTSQFSAQSTTAEDLLRAQTVGLVKLDDFRKRRAEVLELKEREARDASAGRSRGGTPAGDGVGTPRDGVSSPQPPKKKRKPVARGKLSFAVDDEEGEASTATSTIDTPRSITPADDHAENGSAPQRRLGPNTSILNAPKVMTKSAMLKEAQTREQLRKEFLVMQETVKATEIQVPFVFYDGTDIPGGICRVKKGDHIWLFLDKARKVGAELGAGGGDKGRREWARVGVDDLMLVRSEIIIPHASHYEFYYFIASKTKGFRGPLFNYSARPDTSTPSAAAVEPSTQPDHDPLARPGKRKEKVSNVLDKDLEGAEDDPGMTKVVDRRWYEKNKHIFPASVWEEFDPTKDYTTGIRKDTEGNAFFFS